MPGSVGLTVPCLAHGVAQQGSGDSCRAKVFRLGIQERSDANAAVNAPGSGIVEAKGQKPHVPQPKFMWP